MDDLEANPLHLALLTKFRHLFEAACKRSYLIAIPHSDSLEDVVVDHFLANSHILMPSKLLRMHFHSLQAGASEDIEIDGRRLIRHLDRSKRSSRIVANILAEEVGYNSANKEYRTVLIDRPLTTSSGAIRPAGQLKAKARLDRRLTSHDDCSKLLESLSQDITTNLEREVRRLQSNYMILSEYLDDAARRIKDLTQKYVVRYESSLRNQPNLICDNVRRSVRLSVENYAVHLLHGKLIASIYSRHEAEDRKLLENFYQIHRTRLTVCQLGAQEAFADFALNDELVHQIVRLPTLQSPLAMVSCLVKLIDLITEALNQSVELKLLLGLGSHKSHSTTICSDDLIASLVYSFAQVRPNYLFSLVKYLEAFGWSSTDRDQAAYYTATLQIVVQYVLGFEQSDPPGTIGKQEARGLQTKAASSDFIDSLE